jgi:hypothetical protein
MLSPAYRSHLVRVTETEPLSELVWAIRKDPDNERGKYTTEQKIRMSRHRHEGARWGIKMVEVPRDEPESPVILRSAISGNG